MKSARLVNLIFAFTFLAAGVFAAVFLYRDYQQLEKLKSVEAKFERKLNALASETDRREEELAKMQHDTEHIEKVVREKLSYAKPGEVVFRFE